MKEHFEPGLYHLPHQRYHASEGLSQSMIKRILRSPAHARVPVEETPAMRFGRAVHTAVLEPHLFEKEYAILPADCQVGSGKGQRERKAEFEAQAAAQGQTIVSKDDIDRVFAMSEAVWNCPPAAELLRAGERELSGYWMDPIENIPCRMRIDWLNKDAQILVDLKTTQDARKDTFERTAKQNGYREEAAWFLYGISQLTKTEHRTFMFIVVEVDPPHGVKVYKASELFIQYGLERCSKAAMIYKKCLETNEWPAYPPDVEELDIMPWERRKDMILE